MTFDERKKDYNACLITLKFKEKTKKPIKNIFLIWLKPNYPGGACYQNVNTDEYSKWNCL